MTNIHAKEQPIKDILKRQWMYNNFAERQIQEVSE